MRGHRAILAVAAALLLIGLVGAVAVDDRPRQRAGRSTTTASALAPDPPATSTTAPAPTTTIPPPGIAVVTAATKLVITPSGVVAPVLAVAPDGAVTVRTPCDNTAVVRGARAVAPVSVVLDPGHGGVEPGAVGANGLTENALNLAVTRHAERALAAAGIAAVSTRTGDYRVPLSGRAAIVAAAAPKAFVSIHHNGESDEARPGPGTEVFYQHRSPESRRLSGLIYEEVVKALSQYKGVPWQADRDAGVKTRVNVRGDDYYGILRLTAGTTASLAELAFLSNPPEAELLARAEVQQVEGEAVARGIVRYLTTSDPGSGFTEAYPRTSPAGGGGGRSNCVDPPLE